MKVIIDLDILKNILEQSSRNIVGKVCKRCEILENKEDIKKELKELLHEHNRDLYNLILTICKCTESIKLINLEEKGDENGR